MWSGFGVGLGAYSLLGALKGQRRDLNLKGEFLSRIF